MSNYIFTLTFSDPNNTQSIEVLGTSLGFGKNNYSTSLDLVGPGYSNYGQDIAQNFLKLLENFSGPNPPVNAIKGQLWYDTSNPTRNVLKVNNGSSTSNRWQSASGIFQQNQDPSLSYSQSVTVGDIWVDTSANQIKIWTESGWIIVGPNVETGTNKSGPEVVRLQSNTNTNVTFPVILNWINGKVVEIISYNDFTPRTVIDGFSTIKSGVNLTSRIPARYNGIAESATSLYVSPSVSIKSTEVLKNKSLLVPQVHTGTFIIESSSGLQIKNSDTGEQIRFYSNVGGKIEYINSTSNFTVGIPSKSYIKFSGPTSYVGINNSDPQDTLDVGGGAKFSRTVYLTTTANSLNASGSVYIGKNLEVNEKVKISGLTTISNKLIIGDPLASTSQVGIEPAINDVFELGTPTKAFSHLYVSKIGTTGTTITIYGAVSRAIQLDTSRNFSISGQLASTATIAFNGLADVNLVTTATSNLITEQVVTTSTTATQTLLVIDTSTSATGELNQISKADFLADVYAQVFQTGMIVPYGSATLSTTMQDKWILCNGTSTSIVSDPNLFSVIGYSYGGAGADFNVPDLTGVTLAAGGLPIYYIIKR